jgi:hypothetical protein
MAVGGAPARAHRARSQPARDVGQRRSRAVYPERRSVACGISGVRLGGKTNNQKFFMQEAELFYRRLGMLAIMGFAFQEFFLHSAVVDQMPFELMREMIL